MTRATHTQSIRLTHVLLFLALLVISIPTAHAETKGVESAYAVFELYVGNTSAGDTPAYVTALTSALNKQANVAILTRNKAETILGQKGLRATTISASALDEQEKKLKHLIMLSSQK